MLKSLFDWKKTANQNKVSNELVDDKKSLKKGTDYAEKIIKITDKYTKYFNATDLKRYNSYKDKFQKNN